MMMKSHAGACVYVSDRPPYPKKGLWTAARQASSINFFDKGRLAAPRALARSPSVPALTSGLIMPERGKASRADDTAVTILVRRDAGMFPSMTAQEKSMIEQAPEMS